METKKEIATQNTAVAPRTVKSLFSQEDVKKKFEEILGKKAPGFITSVLQIVSQNEMLKNADPNSIYGAAAVAAVLDLPLNNSLGFAYIVPYNTKQPDGSYKQMAQFQIGWKGFVQLAQRSGLYKTISVSEIYEGQLVDENPLTGFRFDFKNKKSDKIIGYAAFFSLINGFEKTLYMNFSDVERHGKQYSKTFSQAYGRWKQDFDSMAKKTVLKLLLSKFGPMSIEMQKARETDQAVIKDETGENIEYVDHEDVKPAQIDNKSERIITLIKECKDLETLETLKHFSDAYPEASDLWNKKKELLTNKKIN